MLNIFRALTDAARSGTALTEALISMPAPFTDLAADLGASIDDARHTLDLARDKAHMALLSAR